MDKATKIIIQSHRDSIDKNRDRDRDRNRNREIKLNPNKKNQEQKIIPETKPSKCCCILL